MNRAQNPTARTTGNRSLTTATRRAVRSELIKFRTLRSNVWLFVVAVGFLLVLGPIQALGSVLAESEDSLTDSAGAVSTALTGSTASTLLLGVLGVLLVAGEYAPRSIRTTFMTLPRRGVVVVAKSVAVSLLILVAGAIAVVTAVTVSMAVLAGTDLDVTWASEHVLRVSAATVWYLVGWGVLGLASGWVTRSKIGGAALLMTVMLVLAPVLGLIPGRVGEIVVALLPSSAGAAMISTHPATADIAGVTVNVPAFGFVVWTAYLVLATIVAAVTVSHRDA
jgi:ABC-2 type transport system permease protein